MASKHPAANFYAISERMHYTIRGEVDLIEDIDGECLQTAVDTAFQRFPYFRGYLCCRFTCGKTGIDDKIKPSRHCRADYFGVHSSATHGKAP